MSKSVLREGAVIRLSLPDGTFGYGRVLVDPYVAFYKLRTKQPLDDARIIISSPVLFTLTLGHSRPWNVVSTEPLEAELRAPILMFWPKTGNPSVGHIIDERGEMKPATAEEAKGLERYAVWSAVHVERRLLSSLAEPIDFDNPEQTPLPPARDHSAGNSVRKNGGWQVGLLKNDQAVDWVEQLLSTKGMDLARETLKMVRQHGSSQYLESDLGMEALAASEVVACLNGDWGSEPHDSALQKWVKRNSGSEAADLVDDALHAVTRVLTPPSELLELWADDEPMDNEWIRSVRELQSRLRRIARGVNHR